MTSSQSKDRSHESIVNDALARVLRERVGLSAVAETLHGGLRPDIIVRLSDSVVILEVEIDPAPTVEADALARLSMEIDGREVQNVFAVRAPGQVRSTSQAHLFERMAAATLEWQEWRSDGTSGPRLQGSAVELGSAVASATPPAGDLDEAVDLLDEGVRRAAACLNRSPGTLTRISGIFGAEPGDEPANMATLVIINAMVFQERLAANDVAFESMVKAQVRGRYSRERLLQIWDHTLSIDYYPIFSMARAVLVELSGIEASTVLGECARTAFDLLSMGAVGRHDLAGRIFNRLISERKLLAAFYTSIPASTLLAGLALSESRWPQIDWGDTDELTRLRVADPACGTGTLLMAAYRQIVQNHAATGKSSPDNPALHQALVENVLFGADVVQPAIHLTAATLAAMSPSVSFSQMELHTLRLGQDSPGKIELGSLDWLQAPETQSFFSGTEEQMGAKSGEGSVVRLPEADVVLSNPPFTRRGSDGGKEDALAKVFSLPVDDPDALNAIAKRTSALLKGTPANQIAGHASSFTVLADRLLKPGGRIALVLPVTALFGESWRGIREMLACRYDIEFVVSSHDPELRSLSYDTGIAEALLVARRLCEDEAPRRRGLFVNLSIAPRRETDAMALAKSINATASAPVLRSDGPPVGGTPLIIGGEPWGEVVDGPVGESSWTPARWKNAVTGQFAAAVERGELWADDGTRVVAHMPVAEMSAVCNVGPQDRQIRGSLGAFESFHNGDVQTQFNAIWRHDSSVHRSLTSEPNAWLVPKVDRDYQAVWSQSGTLHVTRDIQYDSQRIMATRTGVRTLGVRAWHTLIPQAANPPDRSRLETALTLWCNSTFGMLLHVNHSNRTQVGRGTGNKGMLETLVTLDVRKLQPWQLDEAQQIWRDLRERKFLSFHQCAVDPARIELDERIVRDMLGLGEDAVAAVARLRTLLASEPSIHGGKKPELPAMAKG